MRHPWVGVVAIALLLTACGAESATEPEVPAPPTLSGRWVGSTPVATPTGGSYTLTLDLTMLETGGNVSGSGVLNAQGATSFALTIKQGTNSYPSFSLVLAASGYQDMVYSGTFNSVSEVLGKLNGSGFLDQWIALRKQ